MNPGATKIFFLYNRKSLNFSDDDSFLILAQTNIPTESFRYSKSVARINKSYNPSTNTHTQWNLAVEITQNMGINGVPCEIIPLTG